MFFIASLLSHSTVYFIEQRALLAHNVYMTFGFRLCAMFVCVPRCTLLLIETSNYIFEFVTTWTRLAPSFLLEKWMLECMWNFQFSSHFQIKSHRIFYSPLLLCVCIHFKTHFDRIPIRFEFVCLPCSSDQHIHAILNTINACFCIFAWTNWIPKFSSNRLRIKFCLFASHVRQLDASKWLDFDYKTFD